MGQGCAGTWEDCRDDGELGQARNWTTQHVQLEAMVNMLQRPSTGTCPLPGLLLLSQELAPLDAVPSTQVMRVAEDLEESLVHSMVVLYCPRGHMTLISGK